MLKEIYVKDFILIDECNLTFDQHFSVFTGETGAGKSLLIDAISLLCGERAKQNYIKQGKDKAIIEGVFELPRMHPFFEECASLGIECEQDIIITREIFSDGKSNARINHRLIPLTSLKQLMGQVIDIHSQHDTQYLLVNKYHTLLLDEFINDPKALETIAKNYREYTRLVKEYEEIKNVTLNSDDLDYYRFQIKEIEEADLSEELESDYLAEQKRMMSFEKLNIHLKAALDLMKESEGTLETMYLAHKELANLSEFENVEKINEEILTTYYNLSEQCDELSSLLDGLEYNEERFNEIQAYLFTVNKMKRKYGNSIEAIFEKKLEFENKVNAIENRQAVLDEYETKISVAEKKYLEVAKAYSLVRQTKAKELEQAIIEQCHDLYLSNASFSVMFTAGEYSQSGIDKIEFLISMNPGEPLKPLSSVASGGELSRLMLALKTIFTSLTAIDTVIFDEIDTGVSGKIALAIGQKMKKIARLPQVFAITHLAPVAACGDSHYLVEKKSDATQTTTSIRKLNKDERVNELAMIASNSDSQLAKNAANELLMKANQISFQ